MFIEKIPGSEDIVAKNLLNAFHVETVLDIATGSGSFIPFLQNLGSYQKIIGLDSSERAQTAFENQFSNGENIEFRLGDGTRLPFEDQSIDLVAVSNSLHHFENPIMVLNEMVRVLKPNGILLCAEMYSDEQSTVQQNHVLIHHWWAAIDKLSGVFHRETYKKLELIELLNQLPLQVSRIAVDVENANEDPLKHQYLQFVIDSIDKYLTKVNKGSALYEEGIFIKERLQTIGLRWCNRVFWMGTK